MLDVRLGVAPNLARAPDYARAEPSEREYALVVLFGPRARAALHRREAVTVRHRFARPEAQADGGVLGEFLGEF